MFVDTKGLSDDVIRGKFVDTKGLSDGVIRGKFVDTKGYQKTLFEESL